MRMDFDRLAPVPEVWLMPGFKKDGGVSEGGTAVRLSATQKIQ
jgi:hypothetical protein